MSQVIVNTLGIEIRNSIKKQEPMKNHSEFISGHPSRLGEE